MHIHGKSSILKFTVKYGIEPAVKGQIENLKRFKDFSEVFYQKMADFVKEMNEKYSEFEEERKRKHKQSIWRAIFTDLFYIKKRMLSLRHTVVQVKLHSQVNSRYKIKSLNTEKILENLQLFKFED